MRRLVEAAPAGRLATVGADGSPHLVPVCFAIVGDVVYSAVDHKPKRSRQLRRIANIEATGRACLLVDEYRDDWSQLWWVRIDGRARVAAGPREAQQALTALAAKYWQYAERPADGPVIAIDADRWTGWSPNDFPEPPPDRLRVSR